MQLKAMPDQHFCLMLKDRLPDELGEIVAQCIRCRDPKHLCCSTVPSLYRAERTDVYNGVSRGVHSEGCE